MNSLSEKTKFDIRNEIRQELSQFILLNNTPELKSRVEGVLRGKCLSLSKLYGVEEPKFDISGDRTILNIIPINEIAISIFTV